MRIGVTAIESSTLPRLSPMVRTLQKRGHTLSDQITNNIDLWLVDCAHPHELDEQTTNALLAFNGQLVLMTLDDGKYFRTNSAKQHHSAVPTEVIDKATAFAKIQWAYDEQDCDIARQVLIPPFLVSDLPVPRKDKQPIASFYGLPTGSYKTESNVRVRACKMLKGKAWFRGGIIGQEPLARKDRDTRGIEVGHRPRPMYLRSINASLLSICLPGHSVLTYRLFESLGLGSCVISFGLDSCRWLNKLIPNKHHIPVSENLSDLIEICERVIEDQTNALRIASNGYELYDEYYKLLPDGTITDNMWNDIARQWRSVGIDI